MPYRQLLNLMIAAAGGDRSREPPRLSQPARAAGRSRPDRRSPASATAASTPGYFALCRLLCRVEAFGFHLATLDLRQDSARPRRCAGRAAGRCRAGRSAPPPRVLSVCSGCSRARCRSAAPTATTSVERVLRCVRHACATAAALRRGRFRAVYRQHEPQRCRRAGGAGAGAHRRPCRRGRRVPLDVAPLFETVDDLEAAPATLRALLADSGLPRPSARARRPSGGDAGLFRQRQGRRPRSVALGDAAGADRACCALAR